MSRAVLIAHDVVSNHLEILFKGQQPGALEDQVFVVHGESLGNPEHICVIFLVIVEGAQLNRPDSLDIVKVEEFMGDKAQPAFIAPGIVPTGGIGKYCHGIQVFEASSALVHHDEGIMFVGDFPDEFYGPFGHSLNIGDN